MDTIRDRFKDAPWMSMCSAEEILMVGAGGIGSNALYNLTKTIPCSYLLYDPDRVEKINVGTQFFKIEDIGSPKVTAIYRNIEDFTGVGLIGFNSSYIGRWAKPIMIAALDNMATRKLMFEKWREQENREILIDARLSADFYEIFVVTPGNEDRYAQTLFEDSEVPIEPCTYKATAYFGMLCGARITHVMVNYLSNKYAGESIFSLPFKITELGGNFYYETVY